MNPAIRGLGARGVNRPRRQALRGEGGKILGVFAGGGPQTWRRGVRDATNVAALCDLWPP